MQIHVARAGQQLGDFPLDEVRKKLAAGEFHPTDHGWSEGQADWKLLSAFPELSSPIAPPPETSADPRPKKASAIAAPAATLAESEVSGAATRPIEPAPERVSATATPAPSPATVAEMPSPEPEASEAAPSELEPLIASTRPATTKAARRSPGTIAANRPVPRSGMAIASVAFGVLSLTILPFVGAICAIVFAYSAQGRIARANGRLRGRNIARLGLKLGYWGFFVSLAIIMAGVAWSIASTASSKAERSISLSNGKHIAIACRAYADDHGGAYPQTLLELTPKYLPNPKMLECPLSGHSAPIGYEYYGAKGPNPPSKILLVSKALSRKSRIVVRVDTSAQVVRNLPEVPRHEALEKSASTGRGASD